MNKLDQLTQLIADFQAAHEQSDWEKIAELNEQTRPVVESVIAQRGAQAIQAQLESLSALYQKVQENCSGERDLLQKKITNIAQAKTGIQEYSANSSL